MQTITSLHISEVRPRKERDVTLFWTALRLGCVTLAAPGCDCVNPGAVDAWQSIGHQPHFSYYAGALVAYGAKNAAWRPIDRRVSAQCDHLTRDRYIICRTCLGRKGLGASQT